MIRHATSSPEETRAVGRQLARTLAPGDVVALFGELGTGKTQLVMGMCEALGAQGHVASPTFTLIREYPAGECTVVHIDLYRITSPGELAELGIREYWSPPFITMIEWADRIEEHLPDPCIRVRLELGREQGDRLITIEGQATSGDGNSGS
jgi:tRNA threonylcarbamoyladenosine biosynthesis protein TsaE